MWLLLEEFHKHKEVILLLESDGYGLGMYVICSLKEEFRFSQIDTHKGKSDANTDR